MYGMNDFCACCLPLDTDNDNQMAIIHEAFIVHDFCLTQLLFLFFNAMAKVIT